jgi:hypothetical protein
MRCRLFASLVRDVPGVTSLVCEAMCALPCSVRGSQCSV